MLLVGDEGCERNGGKVHLFGRHFNELRDGDFDRARHRLEIGRVGRLVPFEEMRVVDGIFYHEVFCIAEIGGGFRNLVKRGDGWAENVEDEEDRTRTYGCDATLEAAVAAFRQEGHRFRKPYCRRTVQDVTGVKLVHVPYRGAGP